MPAGRDRPYPSGCAHALRLAMQWQRQQLPPQPTEDDDPYGPIRMYSALYRSIDSVITRIATSLFSHP